MSSAPSSFGWLLSGRAPSTRPDAGRSYPPGSRFPLLPGVRSRLVTTERLVQHVYESGPEDGEPLVMLHGNLASGRFFEGIMAALPEYRVIAPDLRGFGASEPRVVDATRGVRDFSDDLEALAEAMSLGPLHVAGWSLGGNVALRYLMDYPRRVRSLTLIAPGSPYGYGGSHGPLGRPNYGDFAGSGAGLVRREVVRHLRARDFGVASLFSPRAMFRRGYVKAHTSISRTREDVLVEQMLLAATGDEHYPGDSVVSRNWPHTAPGVFGPNNAVSPKYLNQSGLAEARHKPPILWLRGANDRLVSDAALTDPGTLGKLRLMGGWPGEVVCPPQPMVTQTRTLLQRYAANGGIFWEEVIANCGHSPHLEHPATVVALLRLFFARIGGRGASQQPGADTGDAILEAEDA